MIRSRSEACNILGIGVFASEEEIKTTYKKMIKRYHPDAGASADRTRYDMIVEAYQYLTQAVKVDSNRILGMTPDKRREKAEKDAYERWFAKMQQEHLEKERQNQKEKKRKEEEAKRQKEEYDRAMEAINAIRIAEAIKAVIKDSHK